MEAAFELADVLKLDAYAVESEGREPQSVNPPKEAVSGWRTHPNHFRNARDCLIPPGVLNLSPGWFALGHPVGIPQRSMCVKGLKRIPSLPKIRWRRLCPCGRLWKPAARRHGLRR